MTRLTLAGVVVWAGVGAVAANPPAEHAVRGKERSPIEQTLHTPERPAAVNRGSDAAGKSSRDPIRSVLLQLAMPRLGVVPLVPLAIW